MSEKTVVYRYGTHPLNIVASIFAVMVSWYLNHSVWWAIFHYLFGWLYLLVVLLNGRFKDGGFMDIINYYFG